METLCIVPCGKRKIWDKNPNAGFVKAKDVYIGHFSIKCKEYAEKFYANSWCIFMRLRLRPQSLPESFSID
ncbi:MAG TPA: hypothetical protein PKM17_13890, partial [Syntrophorhabdus sp.]|nr:hypothetical protein [Syntrophorhabdus sp.]